MSTTLGLSLGLPFVILRISVRGELLLPIIMKGTVPGEHKGLPAETPYPHHGVGGELLNYVASAILCVTTRVVPFNACEKYFSSSFTC